MSKSKELLLECVELEQDDGGCWACFKIVDQGGPAIHTYFADHEESPFFHIETGVRVRMSFYKYKESVRCDGHWIDPRPGDYSRVGLVHTKGDWGMLDEAFFYLNQYDDQRPDIMSHAHNYKDCVKKGEELLLKIIDEK